MGEYVSNAVYSCTTKLNLVYMRIETSHGRDIAFGSVCDRGVRYLKEQDSVTPLRILSFFGYVGRHNVVALGFYYEKLYIEGDNRTSFAVDRSQTFENTGVEELLMDENRKTN